MRSKTLVVCCAVGTLVLVLACSFGRGRGRPPQPRAAGAGVHGSVFVAVQPQASGGERRPVYVPDITVFLRNVNTGVDSAPVVTDLFGRYQFPRQPAGTYLLRWNAQKGWAAGGHKDQIVIVDKTQYPTPAELFADDRHGVLYGRVLLADGDPVWFYDEFFAARKTATITVLNTARTVTLGGPVRANANGDYAVAGLPRGVDVTVRVQSDAANTQRLVASANIAVGGSRGTPANIQLPNRRPDVVTVFPSVAGAAVLTASPGATVTLNAITRDTDGDPLQHQWKLMRGSGTLTPAGATAQWTLPTTPGQYSAYLLVDDGRGGLARHVTRFEVGKENVTFTGRVRDDLGAFVGRALVTVNGNEAITDASGFFIVEAQLNSRYVLNISKRGYALFSRVVDSEIRGQTWTLVKTQEQMVDPKNKIVLFDRRPILQRKKLRGSQIVVEANTLVDANGNLPTGPLTAYLATLDIAGGEAPGDWGARRPDGTETNLKSYGATFVEFLDTAGNKFNLAAGAKATVNMGAATSMLPDAPAEVPLWSYDERDGYWKRSGLSRKRDGGFVGQVEHFSTINTDVEYNNPACLKVLLYPPIPTGVKLRVTDPTGTAFTQVFEFVLDSALNAVYRLPANTDVRLELFDAVGNPIGNLIMEEIPGTALPGDIVNTGTAIPSGNDHFPPEPYTDCKLVILRFDIQATPSIFFTFKGEGTQAQADAYYNAIDPNGLRTTLGDWWQTNGFTFDSNGIPTNAVRTSYLNDNDLGSGRDMYFLQRSDGTVAAYVTNYGDFDQDHGNADLAANRTNPGATVCMEYSPVEGQGPTNIVKFFVFAGNGNGPLAVRQPGAELDGFGVKFVPNLCLNCHGGSYFPANSAAPTFAEVNMQSAFRELDTATYKFPGGRLLPDPGEKSRFKQQNLIVRGLNPGDTITQPAVKDLIDGWYPGASDDQDNSFTPAGWLGAPQQQLYHDIVKTSCRTCHVGFVSSSNAGGISWESYAQLALRHGFMKSMVLCEDRYMPHAVVTYRNLWLSGSPHRPGALRTYNDGTTWPALGNCN